MASEMTRRTLIQGGLYLAAMAAAAPVLGKTRAAALSFEEYRSHDALELAGLVARRDVSALELLDLAIARTEAVNPQINCVVERLYDDARAAIEGGLPEGAFSGVPFLLKDLGIALEGTVTTNGSRFFKNARMNYTSTVVERYQRAGLVIFGKTASPEFGGTGTTESILFGDTRNPWDQTRSAGGSSGGSAAAVAAGVLPMANATDGGGSIRIPASCCGLFGMKVSRGRVPRGPRNLDTTSSMSVIHAVSRSVRDSAALLDATQGAEPGSPFVAPAAARPYLEEAGRDPASLKIALVTTPVTHSPVDPECIKAAKNAAKLCEVLGHEVEEAQLPVDPREFFGAARPVMGVGLVIRVRDRERALGRKVTRDDLEPVTWERYQRNTALSAEELARGRQTLQRVARDIALFQRRYDLILSPTIATPPVKLGVLGLNQDYASYERAAINVSAFTMLYNATGQPAMSVPLHWSPEGLPVGVMFAGRYGDESTLYQLAGQLERAQPWFDRVPAG
ncbi:MAG: amidase [Deltaproteobacteria bacterium]|nr:amidase [Deltaproteobacteria bacterium]